jgi:hypothetical protein
VPLQAVRLAGVLLCAVPGELFAEVGLTLKASGGGQRRAESSGLRAGAGAPALVLPLGLAGGYYGYILPGERLRRGGYEALPVAGRLGGAASAAIVGHFRRFC